MAWVVENLQEELIAADSARMAADEQVQARSIIVQDLQVLLHHFQLCPSWCAATLTLQDRHTT